MSEQNKETPVTPGRRQAAFNLGEQVAELARERDQARAEADDLDAEIIAVIVAWERATGEQPNLTHLAERAGVSRVTLSRRVSRVRKGGAGGN